MKKDNRGITLVELVVAISMAVIVMGAATLFIRSAVNGYRKASDTIDLQMESQVVMEQASTWIMEGNNVKVIEGNNNNRFLEQDFLNINTLVLRMYPSTQCLLLQPMARRMQATVTQANRLKR